MNHDVTHCIDYSDDCPTYCKLAKLQKDLKNIKDKYIQISYAHFLHSCLCPMMSQPERKKGEWERKTSDDSTPVCSECNFEGNWDWHYCPNCGSCNRGLEEDKENIT